MFEVKITLIKGTTGPNVPTFKVYDHAYEKSKVYLSRPDVLSVEIFDTESNQIVSKSVKKHPNAE
jgi:hypothetical protein